MDIIAKNDINILLKDNIDTYNLEPKVTIDSDLKSPISKGAVVGSISYDIDGETYSTDLIAKTSVISSNFETIIFRILLIFLILYLLYIILKKLTTPKNKKRNKSFYATKHKNHSSRNKSPKGGRYKFTQIQDYL